MSPKPIQLSQESLRTTALGEEEEKDQSKVTSATEKSSNCTWPIQCISSNKRKC